LPRHLGELIAETKSRDRVVLATKFTMNGEPGNPNAGGNCRKNVYRALEGSLRRLRTDYVDLYWLHAYDGITPVDEVMSTLDALMREGKVRYFGLSDVPGVDQLEENLHALDFELPSETTARLEELTRPEVIFPYSFFTPARQSIVRGRVKLAPRSDA
jgi:aryl-alcohol dehydrogenase-like predicted oxidoreductase